MTDKPVSKNAVRMRINRVVSRLQDPLVDCTVKTCGDCMTVCDICGEHSHRSRRTYHFRSEAYDLRALVLCMCKDCHDTIQNKVKQQGPGTKYYNRKVKAQIVRDFKSAVEAFHSRLETQQKESQ